MTSAGGYRGTGGQGEAVEHGPLPQPPLAHHQAAQAEVVDQGGEHHARRWAAAVPGGPGCRAGPCGRRGRGWPGGRPARGAARPGSSTWLTDGAPDDPDRGGGRWSPMARRASARTVPPLAITRSAASGVGGQHVGDRARPARRPGRAMAARSAGGQAVPGVELAPDPGRAQGHAGHRDHRVDRADAGLQAPAAEVEPEDRARPRPTRRPAGRGSRVGPPPRRRAG